MQQSGGKDSKRHFTVVMGGKEHGLYISSTPSSAARKAVTKLCAANKSKKVEFSIREITQGSKKKTYGSYVGYIEKLKEPIELKGRVIRYKPVAKLSGKKSEMKGGLFELKTMDFTVNFLRNNGSQNSDTLYKYEPSLLGLGKDKLFFGKKFTHTEKIGNRHHTRYYFPILLVSDGSFSLLKLEENQLSIQQFGVDELDTKFSELLLQLDNASFPSKNDRFSTKINNLLDFLNLKNFLNSQNIGFSIRSFTQNDFTLEDFKMIHNKIRNDYEHYKYIKNILNRNILFFGVQKKLSINNNDYYPFVLLCGRSGYTILVFEEIEKNDNGNVKKYYTLSSYNHRIDNKILKIKGFFYSLNELKDWKKNNDTSLWGKDFHNCIKSILFVENN